MEKIKFRGKAKKSGLWVYGSFIIHESRSFIVFKGAEIQEKSLKGRILYSFNKRRFSGLL